MGKTDCTKCSNTYGVHGCKYDFRMAANAGGAAVDSKDDVWFCRDYDEIEEDAEYE